MLSPIARRAVAVALVRGSRRTASVQSPILRSSRRAILRGAPKDIRPAYARLYSSKSTVDEKIEEIQDQYGTAKDEFEIASEETEKMSVYAEDDRGAAREELDKLKTMFDDAVADPETGEEIKSRVGQRIRELDNAVKNMEEMAQNQD